MAPILLDAIREKGPSLGLSYVSQHLLRGRLDVRRAHTHSIKQAIGVSAFAVMKKTPFKNFINQQNTSHSRCSDDQLDHHTPFIFLSPPLLRHTMQKDKNNEDIILVH